MTTPPHFSVGQKVSFTLVREVGKTIKISSRERTLQALNGEVAMVSAVVNLSNGFLYTTQLSDLRCEGAHSALTEAMLSGCGVDSVLDCWTTP